jgi:O-antigen ligase
MGERPLGWGPGSFETEFARHSARGTTPTEVRIESPHNEALRLAFELGLPGLVLVALLLRGVRGRASSRTWLLRASLLALLVCGLTGKTFEEPPRSSLVAASWGFSSAAPRDACFLAGAEPSSLRRSFSP